MSDEEAEFSAMTDEELVDYLAHDAELPLSFSQTAGAALCAANVLAVRRKDVLPDAKAALEAFRTSYLPIPYDGGTLYDDPPRYEAPPAKAAPRPPRADRAARPVPHSPAPVGADSGISPRRAAEPKAAKSVKVSPVKAPSVKATATADATAVPFFRSGASRLLAAMLVLVAVCGVLYAAPAVFSISSQLVSPAAVPVASSAPVSPGTGYRLTWVPDGYVSTDFSDWDVTGYLYAWKNDAGDKLTFCRYLGGTNVGADRDNADITAVTVCGCKGEYIQKGGWRSLVFSDADSKNVYYLDAEKVSDDDMQKMIASIH